MMVGVPTFTPHSVRWVKQVGKVVVLDDPEKGQITVYGRLVYADNSTAIIKGSRIMMVSRAGHFSERAQQIYTNLIEEEDVEDTIEDTVENNVENTIEAEETVRETDTAEEQEITAIEIEDDNDDNDEDTEITGVMIL